MRAKGRSDRVVRVELSRSVDRSYEVVVRKGVLADAGSYIVRDCPAHRYAIVTDENVAALYGDRLVESLAAAGATSSLFRFPPGEGSKTRETWRGLADELGAAGLGRDSAVIALGGGVVGDLAGFLAATYMRGVPFVQVPTSLLAMLDSSVGGKTGVDTPLGKNLIGAFYQPRLVLIDAETLDTLPDRQLRAGLAEAYKYGLILDADFFDWLEARLDATLDRKVEMLEELVIRSVGIKADVVSRDEEEEGYRSILNFGHTVAHALETTAAYECLHGEAVAVGMLVEAAIGERLSVTEPGVSDRIRTALQRARLPVGVGTELDRARFMAALSSDKKRIAAEQRLVLLEKVGRVARGSGGTWTHAVPAETVADALFLGRPRV